MATLVFSNEISFDIENAVNIDDNSADIYVRTNSYYGSETLSTLKSISILNKLQSLFLFIISPNITIKSMNFVNPNITFLRLNMSCGINKSKHILKGISCMPNLDELVIRYETNGYRFLSGENEIFINDYLDNNKYLKEIKIFGCYLHPNTIQKLKEHCKLRTIKLTYDDDDVDANSSEE
jgi:hypothetical protein